MNVYKCIDQATHGTHLLFFASGVVGLEFWKASMTFVLIHMWIGGSSTLWYCSSQRWCYLIQHYMNIIWLMKLDVWRYCVSLTTVFWLLPHLYYSIGTLFYWNVLSLFVFGEVHLLYLKSKLQPLSWTLRVGCNSILWLTYQASYLLIIDDFTRWRTEN